MNPSRFHLVLTTGLAAGLGAAVTTLFGGQDAEGYPAGATVSLGTNPVVSFAGILGSSATETATTAPADQDLIITDVILSVGDSGSSCRAYLRVALTTGGTAVGQFGVGLTSDTRNYTLYDSTVSVPLQAGIRVPAGESLVVSVSLQYSTYCSSEGPYISYTLSGYYAAP